MENQTNREEILKNTYYALAVKKVPLRNGEFIYLPYSTMIGKVSDDGVFTSENDDEYYSIIDPAFNFSAEEIGYFGATSLDELSKKLAPDGNIEALDDYYIDLKNNYLFMGKYDEQTGNMVFERYSRKELFEKKKAQNIDSVNRINEVSNVSEVDNSLDEVDAKIEQPEKSDKEKEIERLKNIKELYMELNKRIVGQRSAKDAIISSLYMDNMSRCFIAGPSGSGKTEIISTIKDIYNYPVVDATFTSNGINKDNILDMQTTIIELINKAEGDLDKAEHGVIVIEDIDKIKDDTERLDVINTLYNFCNQKSFPMYCSVNGAERMINFDTTHLTILASGNFKDLIEAKSEGREYRHLGFSTQSKKEVKDVNLTSDDIAKDGRMGPKFSEIFGTVGTLHKHTKKELKAILTDSYISPLKANVERFKKDNIVFEYDDDFIDSIVNKAYSSKNDGRALKNILNGITQDIIVKIVATDSHDFNDSTHIYGRVLNGNPAIMTDSEIKKIDDSKSKTIK